MAHSPTRIYLAFIFKTFYITKAQIKNFSMVLFLFFFFFYYIYIRVKIRELISPNTTNFAWVLGFNITF